MGCPVSNAKANQARSRAMRRYWQEKKEAAEVANNERSYTLINYWDSPASNAHRRKLSRAMKRYWANKR